tara:strand:+ start:6718 stop:8874 length:2157 start_codon:yes stop_codon:yes gene_type:complete
MANKSVGLLTIAFGADLRGFDRAMKKASFKISKFGKSMSNIGRNLTAGITVPILGVAGASVKLASDTEESLNKVRVAFGDSASDVENFAETTLSSFGISKKAALEMTSLFGDMGTSLGFTQKDAAAMSMELTGLAGDLASFKNIQVDVAQTALAGVFTGETESLKKLGIMTTEATLKESKYFQSLGKTFKQLTAQEKIMVRYRAIVEQTANATGDFTRTSDSFANQTRILQGELEELGAEVGTILLPKALELIGVFRDMVDRLRNLSTEQKQTIIKWAEFAAKLGPVLVLFGSLAGAVGKIIGMFRMLATLNPVGAIVTVFTLGLTAVSSYAKKLETTASISEKLKGINDDLLSQSKEQLKLNKANVEQMIEETEAALKVAEAERDVAEQAGNIKQQFAGVDKFDVMSGAASNFGAARTKVNELHTDLENLKMSLAAINEAIEQQPEIKTGPKKKSSLDFSSGGSEGEKETVKTKIDLFNEMKDAYADALTEMDNKDKQRYIDGLDNEETYLKNLKENEEAFLEASREMYQEYGQDVSEIDGQILDNKIANMEATKEHMSILDQAMLSAGQSIGTSLSQGAASFKEFGAGVTSIMRDVIAATISQGIAASVANALNTAKILPTWMIPVVAGVAAGLARTAFNTLIPSFADGGIVSGPTLGLMGEYAGAGSNPEVIAPLDKLKSMMGASQQRIEVVGRIAGDDIWLSNEKAGFNRFRAV